MQGTGDDGRSESETSDRHSDERYSWPHEHACGALRKDEEKPAAGLEDARPPGFPSVEELKELNRLIHQDAGIPELFQLDQPPPLESALERARAAYSATAEGVIEAAALLAYGIASAQGFRDGNRRTAYFAVQSFLDVSGYGYLSPGNADDHLLARYLNQVVEPRASAKPGPEKLADLFERRIRKRRLTQ